MPVLQLPRETFAQLHAHPDFVRMNDRHFSQILRTAGLVPAALAALPDAAADAITSHAIKKAKPRKPAKNPGTANAGFYR